MMRNKAFKTLFCLLAATLCILVSFGCAPVSAASKTEDSPSSTGYINPDTGYRAVILDDLDLLTDQEEIKLLDDMKPITEYGNIAFWSTDITTSDNIDQARIKRKELFEYTSGSIFVINLGIRKLTIQSYGKLYKTITDSKARSITNNVSRYATNREYYQSASNAYQQMLSVIERHTIPEPMKITGYIIISVIVGLTITLTMAFSSKNNPLRQQPDNTSTILGEGVLNDKWKTVKVSETKEKYVSSKSERDAFGGCGGGGCAGGGGGGCGGGGGSGF